MTQTAIDRDEALAYRAAGKVVVAIVLGYDVEDVSPVEDLESLFREPSQYPGLMQAAEAKNAEHSIVLMMAGPLAEQRHVGRRAQLSVQSLSDRAHAGELADSFAGLIFRASQRSPGLFSVSSFARALTAGNIPKARFALGSITSISKLMLSHGGFHAARIIAEPRAWQAIEKVAALVLERSVVTGADVRGMLGLIHLTQ